MHRCNKEVSHTMVMGLKIGVYEVFTQANPGQVDGRQGFVGDTKSSIQYNTKQYNPSIASIQANLYIVSPISGIKATQCPKKNTHSGNSLKLTSSVVPELLFLLCMWCQRSLRSLEVENCQLLHLCGLKVADLKCCPLVLLSDCTQGRPWLH